MKKDSKKENAVSPVIGTILLVAITVVLVAIISAVVMGMTGEVGTSHQIGATAEPISGHAIVLTLSGDLSLVNGITAFSGSQSGTLTPAYAAGTNTYKVTFGTLTGTQPITVTASFTDGTSQTIYSSNLILKA